MSNSLLALGINIKLARERLHLSQEKLADRCGFDRTYISLLERGKRNISFLNLERLAKGLDTTVSNLTENLNGIDSN